MSPVDDTPHANWREALEDASRVQAMLLAEIRRRSARLGTVREEPEDMDRVVRLAHDLRNKETASTIGAELLGLPPKATSA